MLILNRTNNKKDDYNGSGMIESCRTDRCACRRCRSGSCCHWDCSLSVLLYTSLMTLYIVVFFKNPQRCAMYFWKFFQTEWLRYASSSSYEFFPKKLSFFSMHKRLFFAHHDQTWISSGLYWVIYFINASSEYWSLIEWLLGSELENNLQY